MKHRLIEFRSFLTPELITVLVVSSLTILAAEMLTPILSLFLAQEGVEVRDIGLMSSLMIVAIAISEISWGWLVDRTDLKIALLMGTLMAGLATAIFLVAKSNAIFYLAFFLFGFYRSPIFIAGRWYMGVNSPAHMRTFAMAIIAFNWGIMQGITGIVTGYISQSWGYRTAIATSVGILVVSGTVLLIVSRWLDFRPPSRKADQEKADAKADGRILKRLIFVTLSLGFISTSVFVAFGVFQTYLPLFGTQVIGINTQSVGILFSVRGWLSALLVIPMGWLADKQGKKAFIPITLILTAISMVSLARSTNFVTLLISVITLALGSSTLITVITALISEVIPVERQGLAMGIYGLMEDLGWMIGPAAGGFLWNAYGPEVPFYFGALTTILMIPAFFLITRQKRFSTAEAATGD